MKNMLLLLVLFFSLHAVAQKSNEEINQKNECSPAGITSTQTRNSVILLNGTKLSYTAYTGYLELKNDTGKLVARVFFTYYKKDTINTAKRSLCFAFNGGPGSSSVWLHMGALGPRRVLLKDDGSTTGPPYQVINNEFTWLDKTDLVFIDPVSTGYSRPANGESARQFHGYVEDIQSIAAFIRSFLTSYERWSSPKFLAGESYGTVRAAGLAKYLTDNYRIYLNGILLISPVLNFGTNDYYIGNELPAALYIPSFTAAAWYHKKLSPPLQADLKSALKESESFALGEYIQAILKGSTISKAEKEKVAERMSYFTGLDKAYILKANLKVSDNRFYKELRREEGLGIGRLDARFTGRNLDDAGEFVDFDPSFTNIDGPFTSAVNDYFQRELNFKEQQPYNIFGNVRPWNFGNVQNQFLNVGESLRDAMTKNTDLKVYVGSGYYDFATPYFTAMYDVAHMYLSDELQKNIRHYLYEAGHMYYIHKPSMIQFKNDIDRFFDWSSKSK